MVVRPTQRLGAVHAAEGAQGRSGGTGRPAPLGEAWRQSHNWTRFRSVAVGTRDCDTSRCAFVSSPHRASCPVKSGLPDDAFREYLSYCATVFSRIAHVSFTDYFGWILFLNSFSPTPLLAETAGSFQVNVSLRTNARLRLAAGSGLPGVHVPPSLPHLWGQPTDWGWGKAGPPTVALWAAGATVRLYMVSCEPCAALDCIYTETHHILVPRLSTAAGESSRGVCLRRLRPPAPAVGPVW